MRFVRSRAQSLIEYVTVISVVTMALTVLFPLVKRAIQGVVKAGADQIGPQPSATASTSKYMSITETSTSVSSSQGATQQPNRINVGDTETTTVHSETNTVMSQ